jgi:hypothetical protein
MVKAFQFCARHGGSGLLHSAHLEIFQSSFKKGIPVEHSVLEIIELENGEVVLQQAGSSANPLLSIKFSDESRSYLEAFGNLKMLIAKAMIQSGVQTFSEYMQEQADIVENDGERPANAVLH